jgi:hypothetical protein
MNHLVKNSACCFSTTEIALYQEVRLNIIWFLFTKFQHDQSEGKRVKGTVAPVHAIKSSMRVEGSSTHSYTWYWMGRWVGTLTPWSLHHQQNSAWCSLGGPVKQPGLHSMWGRWRFKSSEMWHCADRRTGVVNITNCSAFIFRMLSGHCKPLTEQHSSTSHQKIWIYSLSMRKAYCAYQKLNQYFLGVQLVG